jgi:hypothetical protein
MATRFAKTFSTNSKAPGTTHVVVSRMQGNGRGGCVPGGAGRTGYRGRGGVHTGIDDGNIEHDGRFDSEE